MTSIALGTAIFGAVQQARGQLKAGKAAKEAGEAEGRRLDFNAGVADLQADDAIARGTEAEHRFRSTVRGLIGSQRAGFAGQGVDVGTGSAVDVQADAAYLGELDARTILSNAKREAWGFNVQAQDFRMGADVARRGGAAAQTASRYAAATGVLGTGSSLLLTKYGFDRRVA